MCCQLCSVPTALAWPQEEPSWLQPGKKQLQHHRSHMQPCRNLRAGTQGKTSPTSQSFSSSSTSITPCSLLPGSGINHSNQNTQSGKEPRAREANTA